MDFANSKKFIKRNNYSPNSSNHWDESSMDSIPEIDSCSKQSEGNSFFDKISKMCDNDKCNDNSCNGSNKVCKDRGKYTTCISIEKGDCRPNDCKLRPDVTEFCGMIIPAKSNNGCYISPLFRMRRKNKTVTLQWDEFSGLVTATGITFLQMNQPIPNLPCNKMEFLISVSHRGQRGIGILKIVLDEHFNVLFDFQTNLQLNDSFIVYSSAVTWITND